jgi:hypothetical protein
MRSGGPVVFERGELYHVACRSRAIELKVRERVDRATRVQARPRALEGPHTARRSTPIPDATR